MKRAIDHLMRSDPVMARLISRVGSCRIQYHQPVFFALARSIVFQQLNGRAAATIFDRLTQACGERGVTPESILRLRPARMKSAGISPQKTGYLRDLARRTQSGEIVFEDLPAMPDDQVIELLTRVKGIGVWTVHMFLIFALRRPDVLPTGDYGVRTAIRDQYGLAGLPSPAEMTTIAQPWRPWASVACWYLWRSLDGPAEL
jgi:DNA-3-methyladenine glycosylase II